MLERAIDPYVDKCHVTVGILEKHHHEHPIIDYIQQKYDNVDFVILPKLSQGPADTARQIIDRGNIDLQQPILIKDCDSFFEHEWHDGNYVCTSNVGEHELLRRLSAKSFVRVNSQGIITDIVEKQVVSADFCVGAYRFESAELYCEIYDRLRLKIEEVFVSHVIQSCLHAGHVFLNAKVHNYVDVGTATDWHQHNDHSVIFCDIDGTIIKAQSRGNYASPMEPLEKNCKILQKMVDQGCQIIFTTARSTEYHDLITQQLKKLGFQNFQLITGLLNTKRILINDYNDANPYPRAIAVNLPRDSDTLGDFL